MLRIEYIAASGQHLALFHRMYITTARNPVYGPWEGGASQYIAP
jgi:hypothetical protein